MVCHKYEMNREPQRKGEPGDLTTDSADQANQEGMQSALSVSSVVSSAPQEPLTINETRGLLFADETYKVIGACFDVYNDLGCGFLEAVYHEALSIEFSERNIPFVSRQPLSLSYKGNALKQGYAPDFLVFGKIILEIKAHSALCDEHLAQTMNYLKASGLNLGLLVNFGSYPKLEYRRILCSDGRYGS
jgi:GxxExxY protein